MTGAGRARAFGRPVVVARTRVQPLRGIEEETSRRLLSEGEQDRLLSMHGAADRQQFLAGRALARRTLARVTGVPARRIVIEQDPMGRPYVVGAGDVDFTVSHSADLVVVAVCRGLRIGVDVERRVARPDAPRIAERWFDRDERDLLSRSAPALHPDGRYERRWYGIWTLREAHAKARGRGVWGMGADLGRHGRDWQRLPLAVPAGYAGALVALPAGDPSRTDPDTPLPSAQHQQSSVNAPTLRRAS